MPDLKTLTKLFRAIADKNWTGADALARELASAEEKIGHHVAAQRLRGALSSNGKSSEAITEPSSAPSFFLSSALTLVSDKRRIGDLHLSASARIRLTEILSEWTHRDLLGRASIKRRTKLLFHGPPGCGKSVSARALGRELNLPVYVVRFDAIVGAYLGQTALHLRQMFRFCERTPCILLIDEIDALGKRRGNPLDVGELDRVVIALLQELEHSEPAGLLVATSNLAKHLDDALWRRFDAVLEFPRPTRAQLTNFARSFSKAKGLDKFKHRVTLPNAVRSYADVERVIEDAARRRALKDS